MENPIGDITGIPAETVRRYNNQLVHLFSLYLNLMPDAIDADMVEELSKSCRVSRAEAYAQYLAALAGYDTGGRDRIFFEHWLKPAIYELNSADYTGDVYFQNIKIKEETKGKWKLTVGTLRPLEAFVFRDFLVTKDRRMIPQIGFFNEAYSFPAVLEDGREWMTLQPNEMTTTAPAVRAAHGRVLTYGLGLGYFAYHASEKENVTSVTVVDISADVIDLFRTQILPQFPHKQKIKLVCADAFSFADTEMAGNFDFVFADIWHDAGDGKDLYLRMKAYEQKCPGTKFAYWLEDTIRCYLDKELW